MITTTIPYAPRPPREIHVELQARETEWEVAPGRNVAAWGYQGSVPGPTIAAQVGDTIVAQLENKLAEPTVVHWHGIRLPAAMDGTECVQPRVELAVGPFADEGAEIAIESLPYRRTAMKRPRRDLWATLRVGPRAPSVASIPATLTTITPLVSASPIVPRTVRLGARMTLHGHDWLFNDELHHHDAPVKVGELQVWELVNETGMDHPFHLHGFFFQVVAINGVPSIPSSWEDTVNVAGKGRVTIAFRADDRPGRWMYHCHILEHHAAGMMGHFEVVR